MCKNIHNFYALSMKKMLQLTHHKNVQKLGCNRCAKIVTNIAQFFQHSPFERGTIFAINEAKLIRCANACLTEYERITRLCSLRELQNFAIWSRLNFHNCKRCDKCVVVPKRGRSWAEIDSLARLIMNHKEVFLRKIAKRNRVIRKKKIVAFFEKYIA